MNRFTDQGLDLEGIVGHPMNLLCQGEFDLQLVFAVSNIQRFSIMSSLQLYEAGELLATWEGGSGWSALAYQKLLNAVPASWRIVEPAILEIAYENGLVMHILDDSDQYESVVIEFTDQPSVIVV